MTRTAAQVRQQFLDFFEKQHGHMFVPSGPVVPLNDPTLLFTNAGMNQFKDVFLGAGSRNYRRAVNTQKCIRAGGKHNDLEDVGRDTYHHTFFEMLGNWSFGDYFKAEAIEWAWDLLTSPHHWGLDKDRLYATVFAGDKAEGLEPDEDAEALWRSKTDINHAHISRWGKKDNFWEMGESGPCGPCSEIHYDGRTAAARAAVPGHELVNRGNPDVIEIWNLVFIQFNRAPAPGTDGAAGVLTPLPAQHVDTGMGFERIVRVLQGKSSNYDTDLWAPIFMAIESHTGAHPYCGKLDDPVDIAYRVIADHARCLTVALSDGARPGNDGRGYVLRRILRRAVRVAHQTLKVEGPVLFHIVPSVVASLGEVFPGLRKDPDKVIGIVRNEEEAFLKTIDRGIDLFEHHVLDAVGEAIAQKRGWEYLGYSSSGHWPDQDDAKTLKGDMHLSFRTVEKPYIPIQIRHDLAQLLRENGIDQQLSFSGEAAFKLHDTYGFPIDLTEVMARERGLAVDLAGYEQLMEQARQLSRQAAAPVAPAAGDGAAEPGPHERSRLALTADAIARLKRNGIAETRDIDKYHGRPVGSKVLAIWNGEDFDNAAYVGRRVGVIVSRTNFYAEAGGQVGDKGLILTDIDPGNIPMRGYGGRRVAGGCTFRVDDVISTDGYIVHIGEATDDELRVNERVQMSLDKRHRQPVMANHTSTHLLNLALRTVLGDEVHQKGSLVAADRLRFDFSHTGAMTDEQIRKVELLVNNDISRAQRVFADDVPLELARRIKGVRAVFGEQYPDPVRVVAIGAPVAEILSRFDSDQWISHSIEFCGGTHLENTSQAAKFIIVHESALASGVRRIIALTGAEAEAVAEAGADLESDLIRVCEIDDSMLPDAVDAMARRLESTTLGVVCRHRLQSLLDDLREKVKAIRKGQHAADREKVVEQARQLAEIDQGPVIVHHVLGADKDTLLAAMDVVRSKRPDAATMLFTADEIESKVVIVAGVPEAFIKRGLKAGDWVRTAAQICGGGGGGRPDMAQAGGKNPEKVDEAILKARQFAQQVIS